MLGGKTHAFHNIHLSIEEKVQKLCVTIYALILPINITCIKLFNTTNPIQSLLKLTKILPFAKSNVKYLAKY